MKDGGAAGEVRLAVLAEGVVIVLLAAVALVWIIPAETTSGDVLGLPPAFMPNVAVVAIGVLAVLGIVLRLIAPEPRGARVQVAAPLLVAALALLGVLTLRYVGPLAAGLLVVLLGMPALGERRWRVMAITLATVAAGLILAYRPWR